MMPRYPRDHIPDWAGGRHYVNPWEVRMQEVTSERDAAIALLRDLDEAVENAGVRWSSGLAQRLAALLAAHPEGKPHD